MRVSYLGVSQSPSFIAANSVRVPLYEESTDIEPSLDGQPVTPVKASLHSAAKSSNSSFFVRALGDSMSHLGIFAGDVLIVDKSLNARDGDIVIASVNGEMTVQLLELKADVILHPKNKAYAAIATSFEAHQEIFGVVKNVIRQMA